MHRWENLTSAFNQPLLNLAYDNYISYVLLDNDKT